MAGWEDINMIEFSKTKLDATMNALNALAFRTTEIWGIFFTRFYIDTRSKLAQSIVQLSS